MPNQKKSRLAQSALLSGLVSQQQIDHAYAAIRSKGGLGALPAVEIGDELLARELVEQEIVTDYQVEQLRGGRTRLHLGPYIITDWLGQGGMGQVFIAEHQMMGRKVAIKVLPKNKSTPAAINSFAREIKTQAQLDHRNLVRAYDAGHDGNVYFLVTEYVPGMDLRRLIRGQGRLGIRQAASVIRQAAMGLAHAHDRGLVHRDVKPGNILVTPEGIVKVSDLGLAGFLHDAENDPRTGKIVGTADYLSPEKILTPTKLTPVSDIYSLGCTLYYAVTGKVPFPGGSTRDKARRHCEETPWHPRQFNPEVDDDFVDLIADMMEKDPERRVQTANEVAQRLTPWAERSATFAPETSHVTWRWARPGIDEDGKEDTVDDFGNLKSQESSSDSDASQGTFPLGSSSQETDIRIAVPPPPPTEFELARKWRRQLRIYLAVAIPISMAIGGFLTWLFMYK
ncbi:MAG: serine/threonine protein kinase [Planctomycetales bacterium]|nr:serine/threonine protein kinase [Planctomycetales bacterium]